MTSETPWLHRIARRIEHWRARGMERSWVVAVSGGSDSVGLLRVLHGLAPKLGLTLTAATLDHGARGDEGRRDATFVGELAGALGVPFVGGNWSPSRAGHFEADARRARYDWLIATARQAGASVVAVGHTRDDQAETVLHRIVRGSGLHGLAGIPPRRPLAPGVTLVRPLLDVSRDEIRAFLAALGQPYRDDPTNADHTRTRARIRGDLLPKLAAEYNPRVADALVRLARHAAAASQAARREAEGWLRKSVEECSGENIIVRCNILRSVDPLGRAEVVRLAWRRAGWPEGGMDDRRWRRIARLVDEEEAGPIDVGGGVVARVESGRLSLRTPISVASAPSPVMLDVPGVAAWPGGRIVASLDPHEPADETLDLDRVELPLCVRGPAPGDRFDPLGLDGHQQPLADFLRGRGVPREQRPRVPLVCDQRGILWVAPHRIAHRARLTEGTMRTLRLRWEAEAS